MRKTVAKKFSGGTHTLVLLDAVHYARDFAVSFLSVKPAETRALVEAALLKIYDRDRVQEPARTSTSVVMANIHAAHIAQRWTVYYKHVRPAKHAQQLQLEGMRTLWR